MKKKGINIKLVLLFLAGLSLLLYPFISNEWNTYRQSKLISTYEQVIEEKQEEILEETVEQPIVMTDSEIAQKYHLDEHSWEGTVAIWKIRKELGIK